MTRTGRGATIAVLCHAVGICLQAQGVCLTGGSMAAWKCAEPPPGPVLLADTTREPTVAVSWPGRSGQTITLKGTRPWRSPGHSQPMGHNLQSFVAMGGVRLDKALAHPRGAVVRVGLGKQNAALPLFHDLADDATIVVRLEGVAMTQPVEASPRTALMHTRYLRDDLLACGMGPEAMNLYATADPDDPVLAKVRPENARPGALDGRDATRGMVCVEPAADGSITIEFRVPYPLLKHVRDPSQRTRPGTFFEPERIVFEIELLPRAGTREPGGPQDVPGPEHGGETGSRMPDGSVQPR